MLNVLSTILLFFIISDSPMKQMELTTIYRDPTVTSKGPPNRRYKNVFNKRTDLILTEKYLTFNRGWGGSPVAGPFGGSGPWGVSPWGGTPWAGNPWAGTPWGGIPLGGTPWGGIPLGGTPWGGAPVYVSWLPNPWVAGGAPPWGGFKESVGTGHQGWAHRGWATKNRGGPGRGGAPAGGFYGTGHQGWAHRGWAARGIKPSRGSGFHG